MTLLQHMAQSFGEFVYEQVTAAQVLTLQSLVFSRCQCDCAKIRFVFYPVFSHCDCRMFIARLHVAPVYMTASE